MYFSLPTGDRIFHRWRCSVRRFRTFADTATNGSTETTATDRQPIVCKRKYTEQHPGWSCLEETALSGRDHCVGKWDFRRTWEQHVCDNAELFCLLCWRKCVIGVHVVFFGTRVLLSYRPCLRRWLLWPKGRFPDSRSRCALPAVGTRRLAKATSRFQRVCEGGMLWGRNKRTLSAVCYR